jgi:hypothetical protein
MTDQQVPELPPTEYLVMEVLGARRRLGERTWTFPTSVRPALRRLEARDLIGWKSGIVENTCLAWLSLTGAKLWLLPGYVPAIRDRGHLMDDFDIANGAYLQYLETGDGCFIDNLTPDEMRAFMRNLGDADRAQNALR